MRKLRSLLAPAFRLPWLPIWLGPLLLSAPIWLTGKALYWGTVFLQFVPWRFAGFDAVLHGELPLWNPSLGMGAPLQANYQSALLYPPNWLLALLQAAWGLSGHAWGMAVVAAAHWAWGGVGMARLGRRLGFSPLGQAVAGTAYALSTGLVYRTGFLSMNAAYAWAPWVLVTAPGILAVRPEQPLRRMVGFSASLALLLLAGHAQTAWYTLVFAAVWAAWNSLRMAGWRGLAQTALRWAAGGGLAGMLAAVQLLPTAEYLLQSQRSSAVAYDYAVNYSFFPWRLLTLLAVDFFGNPAEGTYWLAGYTWEDALYSGLLVSLLALFGLAWAVSRRKIADHAARGRVRFWWVAGGLAFLLALGSHTPVFPWLYHHVPTFALFQAPTRWNLILILCLILIAGEVISKWGGPLPPRRRAWLMRGVIGAAAVAVGAGAAWLLLPGIQATFIRASAAAGLLGAAQLLLLARVPDANGGRPWLRWQGMTAGLLLLDLILANWGMNPGVPLTFYQRTPESAAAAAEILAGSRLFILERDENGLKYERFFQVGALSSAPPAEIRAALLPNANLLDGIASANNYDPFVPARFARWSAFLQTRSANELPAWLAWMGVGAWQRVEPGAPPGVRLEAVANPLRFRIVSCAISAANEEDAFRKVTARQVLAGGQDLYGEVVLEGSSVAGEGGCASQGPAGTISVLAEGRNHLRLRASTGQTGWLVMADMWYPAWQAFVDGQPADLVRADYLFRAVALPAGEHDILLRYRPGAFTLGAGLTLLGLMAAIALMTLGRNWTRPGKAGTIHKPDAAGNTWNRG